MDPAAFSRLLTELRPALHRYSARMVGSVIDGEDVLQNALAQATEAFATGPRLENPQGWVFRIAHNATLDFLRRRARQRGLLSSEETDAMIDPGPSIEARLAVEASLRTFLRLPVTQRSSVLLMDVLGHSLEEIAGITGATVPAIKAALHRGRARLRTLAAEPDDAPPAALSSSERASLQAYVERFNAHDFDAIRDLLAEEVRLELVARTRLNGRKEVATYFHNYSARSDCLLSPGLVEGRPAVLVLDPAKPDGAVLYFVLLGWSGARLVTIRDFRYARYVMEAAEAVRLAG